MAQKKLKSHTSITLNLLNRISKVKKDDTKLKVVTKEFDNYKKRMKSNASTYFKNKESLDGFMYTLDTIEKRITSHIKRGVYDDRELKRQIKNLIVNSRKYQKQARKIDRSIKSIEKYPKSTKFRYIITKNIKTVHSKECLRRLAQYEATKNGVSQEVAIKESKNLPQHIHCQCKYEVITETIKITEKPKTTKQPYYEKTINF